LYDRGVIPVEIEQNPKKAYLGFAHGQFLSYEKVHNPEVKEIHDDLAEGSLYPSCPKIDNYV
jgi:hypothetical protein